MDVVVERYHFHFELPRNALRDFRSSDAQSLGCGDAAIASIDLEVLPLTVVMGRAVLAVTASRLTLAVVDA